MTNLTVQGRVVPNQSGAGMTFDPGLLRFQRRGLIRDRERGQVGGRGEIERHTLAVDRGLIDKRVARMLHQHPRQAIDFRQRAGRGHFHRVRIVSRSKMRTATAINPALMTTRPAAIARMTGPVSVKAPIS